MKARILLDGSIVVSDVDVAIRVKERRGLKEWYGSFSVGSPSALNQDDEYQIELADRRSGRIHITRKSLSSGSGMTNVQFTGTGPLLKEPVDE